MKISRRKPSREVVPFDPGSAILVRDFELPFFDRGFHVHPEVELTLILRGRGTRFVHDSIEPFSDGDLCLIGAQTPHAWISKPVQGQTVRSIVLQFGEESFGDAATPILAPLSRMLRLAKRGLRLDGAARDRAADAMLRLHRGSSSPLGRYAALLSLLADLTETDLLTPLASRVATTTPALDPNLVRVLDVLHAQPARELPQAAVARRLRMSTSAFSRYFRRHVGKTYVDYVAELRVARACQELVDTEASVADIAFAAGFGNLANFNRWFKRVRRMTPSEYRRRCR